MTSRAEDVADLDVDCRARADGVVEGDVSLGDRFVEGGRCGGQGAEAGLHFAGVADCGEEVEAVEAPAEDEVGGLGGGGLELGEADGKGLAGDANGGVVELNVQGVERLGQKGEPLGVAELETADGAAGTVAGEGDIVAASVDGGEAVLGRDIGGVGQRAEEAD